MYYRNKAGRVSIIYVCSDNMLWKNTLFFWLNVLHKYSPPPFPLKLLMIPYTLYQFVIWICLILKLTAMQLIKSNMKSSHAFVHKTWRFKNYVLYNHNWTTACEVAGHETPANVFIQVIPFQVTYKMLSINTTCFTNARDIETTLNMQFWVLNGVNGSTILHVILGFKWNSI